jgi:hypothetical protein
MSFSQDHLVDGEPFERGERVGAALMTNVRQPPISAF